MRIRYRVVFAPQLSPAWLMSVIVHTPLWTEVSLSTIASVSFTYMSFIFYVALPAKGRLRGISPPFLTKPIAQVMISSLVSPVTCLLDQGMSLLDHSVYLSPLVDVLFTHYVRVDEEVSVPNTEMFLAGGTFEAFEVIHFVLHPHRHLVGPDPLVAGGAEAVLAKEPKTTRTER